MYDRQTDNKHTYNKIQYEYCIINKKNGSEPEWSKIKAFILTWTLFLSLLHLSDHNGMLNSALDGIKVQPF